MENEDEIRRRRMMAEALSRGLQRPRADANDILRQTPMFAGGQVGDFMDRVSAQPAQPARSPITVPANAGLSLPQPTTSNIDVSGIQPPTPNQPVTTPAPTPRIGYSMEGLSGVDRLIQRRRALEDADPESKVSDEGEILPPQKTGRLRGLGQGLAVAGAQADPNHPMFALGQLLGGGIGGAISPRSSAKNVRRFDTAQLDNDIARGLKLKREQVELDRAANPIGQMSTRVVTEGEYPGIEAGTEIRVRVDPRTGSITDVVGPNNRPVISDTVKRAPQGAPHYEKDSDGFLVTVQGGRAQRVTDENGKPLQVKRSGSDEEYVEVEVNGRKLRVTPGQALNYYGQTGEREAKRSDAERERQSKYDAAKSEYDSLVVAEEDARKAKDAAYQTLDQMRKSGQPKEDIEQADQAAKAADTYYRTFGEKKKDAGRRMLENQAQSSTSGIGGGKYAGQRFSRVKVHARARELGMTPEQAEKTITDGSGTIY